MGWKGNRPQRDSGTGEGCVVSDAFMMLTKSVYRLQDNRYDDRSIDPVKRLLSALFCYETYFNMQSSSGWRVF